VQFEAASRRVSVTNNGPGIPMKDDDPGFIEQLCCQVFSGSNFDDSNRYTGGSNGCGIKLVNFNSREFRIKTVTQFRKKRVLYAQTFRDGADVVAPADIAETDAEPFTEVRYELQLDDGVDYTPMFLARTVLAAGWFAGTGVSLFFN
jgi:DNA gyrase/topoisomerase IV subunit B